MKKQYTKRRLDETVAVNESFKNKILGWIGIKSNQTEIEDIIDDYYDRPKGAELRNRPKLKKLMIEFAKDPGIRRWKEDASKNAEASMRSTEYSYENLVEEITQSLRKRVGKSRFQKNRSAYLKVVKMLANAFVAMIMPAMTAKARNAYMSYKRELDKAAEEKRKKEELARKYAKGDRTRLRSTYDPAGSVDDPNWTGGGFLR